MKMNEICEMLGITKKAVVYYEKQDLIKIPKDENAYRSFDENHLSLLREITLYRKLSISTKEIKTILDSDSKSDELKSIAVKKELELKGLQEKQKTINEMIVCVLDDKNIKILFDRVCENEIKEDNFIISKFKEAFPGGLGVVLAMHFSNFKFKPIKTEEENMAWIEIIRFLDDTKPLEISEDITDLFDEVATEEMGHMLTEIKSDVLEENFSDEKIREMKKLSEDNMKLIEREASNIHKSLMEAKSKLKEVFESEAYKKHVINNMMILSDDYRQYYNNVITLGNTYEGWENK